MIVPDTATAPAEPASLSALAAELAASPRGYDPERLAVDVAREFLMRAVPWPRSAEPSALDAALGRVLAEDRVSPIDVPPHDNAAMDGYALRGADLGKDTGLPTTLALHGRHMAGDARRIALASGECCRITTGAMLPLGADTVVPQELVQQVDEHGITLAPGVVRAGQHVRRAGEDLRRGEVAVSAGRRLTPADLGLLASLGCWQVPVRPALRVAVFTTGNELVEADRPLTPGAIHDSNRHTLTALLRTLGIEPLDLGIVRDEPAALERALRAGAQQADALLSSGGVGVGDADHTLQVAARLGDAVGWKLAMRPGRPMVFARLRRATGAATVPYFGLPGNPVAAAVGFLVLVQSALRAMQGETWSWPQGLLVPAGESIRKRPGRTEYLRGVLRPGPDGRPAVFLAGDQGSGVLKSLARADLLIELPASQGDVAAGDPVATIRLG